MSGSPAGFSGGRSGSCGGLQSAAGDAAVDGCATTFSSMESGLLEAQSTWLVPPSVT
eukprot:SAG11_NODE_13236_length_664_cov_0.801770_1_plen_56_part_10